MKDKNKNIIILILGSIFTITIATVLFLQNKGKNNLENFKEDITKPYVYDALYTNNVEAASYDTEDKMTYKLEDIKVPYINLKGEKIKVINNKYKELYDLSINNYITGFSDKKTYVQSTYESYIGKELLSTVLVRNVGGNGFYLLECYPYTIEINTSSIMTYEELLKHFNKTNEEVKNKVIEEIESKYKALISKDDLSNLKEKSKSEFLESNENNELIYYINKDGLLSIKYKLYLPSANGYSFEEVAIK